MHFDIDFHSLLYRQWEVHFERGVLKNFFHPLLYRDGKDTFTTRSEELPSIFSRDIFEVLQKIFLKFVGMHKIKVCFLCNLILIYAFYL